MPDTSSIDPSREAQPTPAQALLELAGQLERGDQPEMEDLKAALGSFRAAGFDKPVQQMAIEAREDVRQGRYPDAILLRMLARGLSGEPVARRGRPPGTKNKPKVAAVAAAVEAVAVALGGELDFGMRATIPGVNEGMNRAAARGHAPVAAAPGLKDWDPDGSSVEDDAAEPWPSVSEWAAKELGEDDRPLTLDDIAFPMLAAPIDVDQIGENLRAQADRAVDNLTDREREVLRTHFTSTDDDRPLKLPLRTPKAAVIIRPEIAEFSVLTTFEEVPPTRSPSEWVALAADVIEHLEMPAHAELCGELYALAELLEVSPPVDSAEMPLLERVEKEIERRVRRAIESPADLPQWVIDWSRWARVDLENEERRAEDAKREARHTEIFGAGGIPRD